ncbi:MAG: prepilin-type N-terminal cleavage/methylation domain-containing protein [Candidatus Pacebacteria bacterium]|jgi:prepilin-type N-terminal cleavage/methylation domain-containing protein|nr:prepilin-type N-terminal cleavage/methylation domain-containing protein [Candidatus Paceibacterota bacterium]
MMLNFICKFLKRTKKGFTLVEVLVAVGLFLMIIITISHIYITVLRSEQVAYALLNSENNIRDNLELIARTVRMGKDFVLDGDKKGLTFLYFSGKNWEKTYYRFDESNHNLNKNGLPLFDDSVLKIEDFQFSVKDKGAHSQKIIIVYLNAFTVVKKMEYRFNIETAITPRLLPNI